MQKRGGSDADSPHSPTGSVHRASGISTVPRLVFWNALQLMEVANSWAITHADFGLEVAAHDVVFNVALTMKAEPRR